MWNCSSSFWVSLSLKNPKNFLAHEELDCPVTIFFCKKTKYFLPELNVSQPSLVGCWKNPQMPHLFFRNRARPKNAISKSNVGGFQWLGTNKIQQETGQNTMVRVETLPNFCLTCYHLKHCLEMSIAAGIRECLQDKEHF